MCDESDFSIVSGSKDYNCIALFLKDGSQHINTESYDCGSSKSEETVQSRAHFCKILLNSNMLRLTYPVENEFETALPPLNVQKIV